MNARDLSEPDLLALIRAELFTCVVGDVMDSLGFVHQYLPPHIRPLSPDMIVAGRAMPVLEANYFAMAGDGQGPLSGEPFGIMLRALDDLKHDEVYVASGTTGSYAMWGEIMSSRAKKLGAAGAVIDGYVRDTHGIVRSGFATFSQGSYGQDQGARGKVVDFRVPVEIGQVRIEPGSILFGDIDGVLAIPKEAEREVIEKALEKVRGEKTVSEKIRQGMSAQEAFAKYGIL